MRKAIIPLAAVAVLAGALEALAQPDGPAVVPAGHRAVTVDAATGKVCVTEMKATKKVVFGSECKPFCQPRSCLANWLWACCGFECAECADGPDCGLRTKNVLLKKSVPGPEVPKCVLKDVPVCATPGAVFAPVPAPGKPPMTK
jgi:hypothetical protein